MVESYLTRLSRLLGPACVGAAVWCAAGLVSVESATTATVRVAAPAPWWVFVAGLAAASFVRGWRQFPLTAAPALLATVPWWPVPLPAVALIWTGPLAWLPILAALAAADGSRWLGGIGRTVRAHDPRRGALLAGALTFVLGVTTLVSLQPRLPDGDEPHYLVITQSLWLDGDLRIENNHVRRDYAQYTWRELQPDHVNRGRDGEIYSIHAPGVSVLVLPGFVLFGLVGAQVTILLCLVGTSMLVWRVAWMATDDAGAAWFAWAGVMGAATTVLLGVMIFPDSPAALGSAAAVWWLVSFARGGERDRVWPLVAVSATLAALPWLHTRFAVLSALLGLAVVIALGTDRGVVARTTVRRVAAFLTVPVVSAAAWFLSFWLIYGTADPRAPYKGAESIRDWIWGAVVGLFADQQFGLFVFAPVLVAALVGACRAPSRPLRWVCVASAVTVGAYTVAVASYHMWWAGLPGLPARFLTATLPLFAVPLALGWTRATSSGRAVLLAILGVSGLLTAVVIGVDHGAFAFNLRDGQARWLEWLGPVANLPRAWPSFFWRTQQDFLWHTAVVAAMWGAGWLVLRVYVRRHMEQAALGRTAVAAWVLVGLMGAAEAGWQLNGVTGLDPARSQLAVHGMPHTLRVAPLSVSRFRHPEALVIRPEEAPLSDRPLVWVMLAGPVPAGEYRMEVEEPIMRDVTLTARIGRSPLPLATWSLTPGVVPDMTFSLPVGAAVLAIDADSPESAAAVRVALRPRSAAIRTPWVARTQARGADADVYLADDAIFIDDSGFWVRGGREATVAWSGGAVAAGRPRVITLRNGGAANDVTLRKDKWQVDLALEPWEERRVSLPVADATGTWRVSIRSASGFQPSAVSDSTDTRYLGVWVER
jgi:hypothetical protein